MVYPMMYEENFDEINMLLREACYDEDVQFVPANVDHRGLIFIGSGCDAPTAWGKSNGSNE